MGTVIGRKRASGASHAVDGAQADSPAEKRLHIYIRLHHEDVLFREHMGRTKEGGGGRRRSRCEGNQSVTPSLGLE